MIKTGSRHMAHGARRTTLTGRRLKVEGLDADKVGR